MSFLGKLFGGKPEPSKPAADPRKDPELIQVFDKYGRELFIKKEEWRKAVLPGGIKSAWNKPDELYTIVVQALNDGFRTDVLDAARRVFELEPDSERAACLWAIVLREEGRLDEAEKTLQEFTARNGEKGFALVNLAKVYAQRKEAEKAEALLWHALELDPNQENGLGWYYALRREQGGDEAAVAALRRLASLPGSWRAQLWLARAEIKASNLADALAIYRDSLARAGQPPPIALLQQMSGDLGLAGRLRELVDLVEPLYDAKTHGLAVGNNLLKAHVDLGEFDVARRLLDELYALGRMDWKQALQDWDTTIARERVAARQPSGGPIEMAMLTFEGPVWLKPDSPPAALFGPVKRPDAPRVAFLGSSARKASNMKKIVAQLADAPGRLSRSLPLFLTEQVHFGTSAEARTLLPWIVGGTPGFVLSGAAWGDQDAAGYARKMKPPSDFLVAIHLLADEEPWKAELRLIRASDAECLGALSAVFSPDKPQEGLRDLARRLLILLSDKAALELAPPPPLYRVPSRFDVYLLRLEQLMAVRCAGMEGVPRPFLSGEHEIIDGCLQLCLEESDNPGARVLLAQTALAMKRVRPELPAEFKDKFALLQKDKPIPEPARGVVQRMLDEAVAP